MEELEWMTFVADCCSVVVGRQLRIISITEKMSNATRLNPEKKKKKENTLKGQLHYEDISVLFFIDWKGQNVIILRLTHCPSFCV